MSATLSLAAGVPVFALDGAGAAVTLTGLDLGAPGPFIRHVNAAFEEMTA
jgi:hypothetical protein